MKDDSGSSIDCVPPAGLPWREWECAVLAALVIAIYFARLTVAPICGEESRWATAAREMIASGDWIVPRQQGAVFPERPPLNSWAMAALGVARGQVDIVAIRLPSACATLLLTLGIYFYARSWTSRLASFAAAVIYATCGQVLPLGRFGESEAVFTLLVGGALLVWHAGYVRGWNQWLTWSLGYSLAALGALAKGPQAPVYFVLATVAYLLARRDWRWLFGLGHLAGIACFAAIVAAWMVPFALGQWHAVDDIWTGLARERFTTVGLLRHLAVFPFETFVCLLPWSPLLLLFARRDTRRAIIAAHPAAMFLVVAVMVTYPSIWLAAGARGRYFMPLYPCLAVLMGLVVEQCAASLAAGAERTLWRAYLRTLAAAVLVGGAVLIAARLVPNVALAELVQPPLFLALLSGAAVAAAGVLMWASLANGAARAQIALATLACFLGMAYTGAVVNARAEAGNDLAPALAQLKEKLADPGELVSFRSVYHRFAYCYDVPIRQIPWPMTGADLPTNVTWFCFDWHPLYTDPADSTSDGWTGGNTPRLPFEWDEVARIACDPVKRAYPTRTVVIGRVRRGDRLASPQGANSSAR